MIQTRSLSYSADGVEMKGFFIADEKNGNKKPTLLLVPEAPGLDDMCKHRGERLAALGYAVLVVDFHGNGDIFEDMNDILKRLEQFNSNPLRIRTRLIAALEAACVQPESDPSRVAVLGYCFGGTAALELARSGADIKAVIGFHSGLTTVKPEDTKNIRAKVLILNGADDPVVPPEQRIAFEQEMTAANIDWQLHVYGGVGHAYTRPGVEERGMPGFAYNETADKRAWQSMLGLLNEAIGPV
jgi:dienelactone hydrolase